MSERVRGPEIATSAFGLLAMTKKEDNDMRTGRVRVPQVRNIEAALRLYYERLELSNKDIKDLFETSAGTVYRLKALAKEEMDAMGIPCWNATHVNTEAAYKAWGLDVQKMERNYKRLQSLRLKPEGAEGGA